MFEIYELAYEYLLVYLDYIILGIICFIVGYYLLGDLAQHRFKELYFQKAKEHRMGRRIGNIVYIKNKREFFNPDSKVKYVKGVVFVKRSPFVPRWFSVIRGYFFAIGGRYTKHTYPFRIMKKLMTIEKSRVVVDAKTFTWNGKEGYFEAEQETPETLVLDPGFYQNWMLNRLRTTYKKAITGASSSPVAVHMNMQRFSVPLSPDDYKEDTFYKITMNPNDFVTKPRYSRLGEGFLEGELLGDQKESSGE